MSAGSSDDFKRITEALLKPIIKVCMEKPSQTRCASEMNRDDLCDVRKAFRTMLQIKDAENNAFVKQEEFWRVRSCNNSMLGLVSYMTCPQRSCSSRVKSQELDDKLVSD